MINRSASNRILSLLEGRESASPIEIGDALGIAREDANGLAGVRQNLRRLLRSGQIARLEHGRYSFIPEEAERARSPFQFIESAIFEFLGANGGVARTKDIYAALHMERPPRGSSSSDIVLVTRVLAQSPLFEQSFGHGHWNLIEDALAKVPLRGRWALRQIDIGYDPASYCDAQHVERVTYCDMIGFAFSHARAGRAIGDVVSDPVVAGCLTDMLGRCSDGTRDAIEAEAGVAMLAADDSQLPTLHAVAYTQFEAGNIGLHWVAPVEFYTACAAMFDICPAALSRGSNLD